MADEAQEEPTAKVPKHALTEEDKSRIKYYINSFDLEPGYPCAHREPLLYFHDGKMEWKDIYDGYVKSLKMGERVVSGNRFREYVKFFFPRLRLKRHETDVCNACFRIDTELLECTDEDRKKELQLQKETHIGNDS